MNYAGEAIFTHSSTFFVSEGGWPQPVYCGGMVDFRIICVAFTPILAWLRKPENSENICIQTYMWGKA
jgi:hypothetical protein